MLSSNIPGQYSRVPDILDECDHRQYRDRKMEVLSKKSENHSPSVKLSPVNDVISGLDLGKYQVWTQKSIGYQWELHKEQIGQS